VAGDHLATERISAADDGSGKHQGGGDERATEAPGEAEVTEESRAENWRLAWA